MPDKRYRDFIARIKLISGKIHGDPLFPGKPADKPVFLPDCRHREGSLVQVELDPSGGIAGIKLLAQPESAQSKIYEILTRFDINPSFPAACHDEVESILNNPGTADPRLADFRDIPFVTIDNEGSRDLDQAVYVSKGDNYTVYYALADASYYVKPGMALFEEGVKRGASYYLPGLSLPMLPEELSEGIISLNPGLERRAVVFITELDGGGNVLTTDLKRGRIKSRRKLTYGGVQEYYDTGKGDDIEEGEYRDSLDLLKEIGEILIRKMMERDVVRFHRNEEVIGFTSDNREFTLALEERNDCSRYNEQISLLCNREGARIISGDPDVQSIFRVHDAPTEESLKRLETVIEKIVDVHGLDPGLWKWKAGAGSLADYLQRIHSPGKNRNIYSAIERQVLISNERSYYDENESGHYALGVSLYSRFSSPMREIIGIFLHKELMEKLGLTVKEFSNEEDETTRKAVIPAGNRSKEVQKNLDRAVNKLVVDQVFREDLDLPGEERRIHEGTILGIKSTRLYVRLHDIPLEVKVYVEEMEKELGVRMEYRNDSVFIESRDKSLRLSIGEVIRLRVFACSERGKWILIPV